MSEKKMPKKSLFGYTYAPTGKPMPKALVKYWLQNLLFVPLIDGIILLNMWLGTEKGQVSASLYYIYFFFLALFLLIVPIRWKRGRFVETKAVCKDISSFYDIEHHEWFLLKVQTIEDNPKELTFHAISTIGRRISIDSVYLFYYDSFCVSPVIKAYSKLSDTGEEGEDIYAVLF